MAEKVSLRNVRDIVAEHGQALDALQPVLRGVFLRLDGLDTTARDVGMVAGEAHALATPRTTFLGRLRWVVKGY